MHKLILSSFNTLELKTIHSLKYVHMSLQTQTNSTIVNGSLLALIMVNNSTDIGRSLSSISKFTRCFYSHIQSKRIVKQRRNSWHKFQAELYCTHTGKHVLVLSSTNALNDDNFTKTIEYQCNLQFCKLTESEMENTIFFVMKMDEIYRDSS